MGCQARLPQRVCQNVQQDAGCLRRTPARGALRVEVPDERLVVIIVFGLPLAAIATAAYTQWNTLIGQYDRIVRIAAAGTDYGDIYRVADRQLFQRLEQCVGATVTVRTGAYPGFGERWVVAMEVTVSVTS